MVGASDIKNPGERFGEPKKLDYEGINRIKKDFIESIKNLKEAGIDGVELHAANGYLIDQFLRDGVNNRTD